VWLVITRGELTKIVTQVSSMRPDLYQKLFVPANLNYAVYYEMSVNMFNLKETIATQIFTDI